MGEHILKMAREIPAETMPEAIIVAGIIIGFGIVIGAIANGLFKS